MTPRRFTQAKFCALPLKRQHKNAAEVLQLALVKEPNLLPHYHEIASWLNLPPTSSRQDLYDRYHHHLTLASITPREHHFLPQIKRFDNAKPQEPTQVALYLDHIRSAHNVGSILRTAESFGIHNICFSPNTPFIDNPKVIATSKQTAPLLNCHHNLDTLPRPFIALETHEEAHSIHTYNFPKSFTLILGNEEYSVSEQLLDQADAIVHIPLHGTKNSLNVSNAFAITAASIAASLQLQ